MYVSNKKRGRIFNKTDGKCAYCGDPLEPFGNWEIDHVLPKSRGGGNEITNLSAACHSCNRIKGTKTANEWKGEINEELGLPPGTFQFFYTIRLVKIIYGWINED